MGQEVLEKFGSYILLDRIGSGGMAHIFRARPASAQANGRILVIKRILPHIAEDPFFLNMFKSEVQVCMGFSHPNTVHIYRFGEIDGQAFYAMEHIEGVDLKQLILAFTERNLFLPIELTLAVVETAARGLHYAHTFESAATGLVYRIVHRDVSPQNILISFDGNAKVIDFGIAKAALRFSENTRRGVIKGKASYLSPEQASQQPVDARSDVFALGVVLWELLTARKLFYATGGNDLDVLNLVRESEKVVKPPSVFNSNIPPELDAIVVRALEKDREKRFQSAEELELSIHAFLAHYKPGYGMPEVGRYLRNIFKDKIAQDRKTLQELNLKAQKMLEAEPAPVATTPGGTTIVQAGPAQGASGSFANSSAHPLANPLASALASPTVPVAAVAGSHARPAGAQPARARVSFHAGQAPPLPPGLELLAGARRRLKNALDLTSATGKHLASSVPNTIRKVGHRVGLVTRLNRLSNVPLSRRAALILAILTFVAIKADGKLFLLDSFFEPRAHYSFAALESPDAQAQLAAQPAPAAVQDYAQTVPQQAQAAPQAQLAQSPRTVWVKLEFFGKTPKAAWINGQPMDLRNPMASVPLDSAVTVIVEKRSKNKKSARIRRTITFPSRDYRRLTIVPLRFNLS